MKIEKATRDDHDVLTQITKKSKAYWGYSEEQIKQWEHFLTITVAYLNENQVYKLLLEDTVIGYYSFFKLDNATIKLDNLFITPAFIGKGFGNYLVNDFFNRVKRNYELKKIILESDPNAELFYQKIGFIKIGEFETSIKNRFMPVMEMNL